MDGAPARHSHPPASSCLSGVVGAAPEPAERRRRMEHPQQPEDSMSQDLSEAVKAASREVHSQAENSEFMKNFQKGQVTRDGFKVCGLGGPALGDQPWCGGKIAQKALDLPSSGEGVAFFTFPNVVSATKFKQLYRSRMNSLEMTPEVRHRVIEEVKSSFLLNIQLFEELQELLTRDTRDQSPSKAPELRRRAGSRAPDPTPSETPGGKLPLSILSPVPLLRWVLTLSFLVATVAVGLYAM
nr:PREDICTED: heme oxygenase 1 [Equus przewalskii]